MEERPVELPEGFFERLRKNPWEAAALTLVAIVVLALIGTGIALIARRRVASTPPPSATGYTPAPTSTPAPSAVPTRSAESSSSSTTSDTTTQATSTPSPGSSKTGSSSSLPARVPLIAYHVGDHVYVSAEDGSSAHDLGALGPGPLALSPDGRTLALVAGSAKSSRLLLVRVADARVTTVGPATQLQPVWEASSASLVYQAGAHDASILRVERDGSGKVRVGSGSNPGISPRGSYVLASARPNGLSVFTRRSRVTIATRSFASALWGGSSVIFYATSDSRETGAVIHSVSYGGRSDRVVGTVSGGGPSTPELVLPSPDGKKLLVTMSGDDGFSRLFVVTLSSRRVTPLTRRRDGYDPVWTTDSSGVVFVEGNPFQDEPTRLVRVASDGGNKQVLVQSATP